MKHSKWLSLIFIATFFVSCATTKKYTINGTFSKPQNEEWIYIQKMFTEELIADSARIENGKFTFKGKAPDFPEAYAISYYPTKRVGILYPVFLEAGIIHIHIDTDDWQMKSTVSGGKANKEYRNFEKQRIEKYITEIWTLNQRLNDENVSKETQDSITTRVDKLWKKAEEHDLNYVKQHPKSPASIFIFSTFFDHLPLEKAGEMLNMFSEEVKQTDIYKTMEKTYKNQLNLKDKTTAIQMDSTAETLLIDLEDKPLIETLIAQNPDKVIYIDVWATWCGNCIKEFPDAVALHEKLDKNNITFVYIAIDSPEDVWKKIIQEKQLKGQHILLNKKQVEHFKEAYIGKTISIPRYMIIDKNGKIVDDNAPRPSDKKTAKILSDLTPKI